MPAEWIDPRNPKGKQVPILTLPFRVSVCPHCLRVFEDVVQYCPYCESPTRLYSPMSSYVHGLGQGGYGALK